MDLLLALLLASPARAWETAPVEVQLTQEVDLFSGVEVDSGWQPADGPISVAFRVTSEGGAGVAMDAVSVMGWPEAVTHRLDTTTEGGIAWLDAALVTSIDLRIDIAGVLTWEGSLASVDLAFTDDAVFEPLLLEGDPGAPEVALEGAGGATRVLDTAYEIVPGVSAGLVVDLTPVAEARYHTRSLLVGDQPLATTDGTTLHDPPTGGRLDLDLAATGAWSALLDLVFTTTVEVCVDLLGCWDLVSYDVPVTVVDTGFDEPFPVVPVRHEFPVAVPSEDALEFGEVEVGDTAVLTVDVFNDGAGLLEGVTGLLGAGEFDAYPGDILAAAGSADGVVVFFAPTSEGEQTGSLVLETSDPAAPFIEIPLHGTGVAPAPPEEDAGGEVATYPVEACGCATAPTGAAPLLPLLLVLVALRRRAPQSWPESSERGFRAT